MKTAPLDGASRASAALLKAEHFIDSMTSLTARGLVFHAEIGHGDREAEVVMAEDDELVPRFAARSPSLCIVNPRVPSAGALKAYLTRAQKRDKPGEAFDVGYGLPGKRYDHTWAATIDGSGFIQEGQTVVLVCFDAGEVVGHATLGISVLRQRGEAEVTLALRPELVFVVPSRRGQGFGMDLSVACGLLAQDVLRALYRAVPAQTVLETSVYADYESEGGEAFTNHLNACMDIELDMLREHGKRSSVQPGRSFLDAGY